MSICSIEDVAANVAKPFWFQLYVMKDRGFIKALIERAIAAKCSALVLTVDLQVIGQRHADIKNGNDGAAGMDAVEILRFCHQAGLGSPACCAASAAPSAIWSVHLKGTDDITGWRAWTATQFDTTLNWKDSIGSAASGPAS